MAYTRKTKLANNPMQVIVLGVLVMLFCTIIITGALTAAIEKQIIREENIRYIIPVIQLLSVLTGASYSIRKMNGKFFMYSGILAGIYVIVVGGFNVIVFDGLFQSLIPGILFVAFGALSACLIRMVPNKKKYGRHR